MSDDNAVWMGFTTDPKVLARQLEELEKNPPAITTLGPTLDQLVILDSQLRAMRAEVRAVAKEIQRRLQEERAARLKEIAAICRVPVKSLTYWAGLEVKLRSPELYAWADRLFRAIGEKVGHQQCRPGESVRVKVPADLECCGSGAWKDKPIDSCIAPIVKALQEGGIDMRGSCCGHGDGDGQIELQDGRVLVLLAQPSGEKP